MQRVPKEAILRQLITLIPVNMNVLMMGCAIGWIPNAIYFLTHGNEVNATASECNMITILGQLGKFALAIPGGIVVDKYGRKKVTIGVAVLNVVSWLGLSLSTSLVVIYVGQFTLGVGQALVQETSLITIGEIASPAKRGQLSCVYQIFLSIGVILPAIISVIFSSYKILSWVLTLFSFIALLSMIIATETPSFLISKSKFDQARESLLKVRRGCPIDETETEFEALKQYIEDEKTRRDELNFLSFITLKSIRGPLLASILIKFFAAGTGRNVITNYVTIIFPANDFVSQKCYPLITQVIILSISIATFFYIEKFRRRSILMFGAIAITIIHSLAALFDYIYADSGIETYKWLFVLANGFYFIFFNGTVQPINSTIKTEIFPQAIKGLGGSFTILSQAASTSIGLKLYGYIGNSYLYYIYVFLAINSLILYFIVYFLLPESRGSSLVDVQMKYQRQRISNDDLKSDNKKEKERY